MKQIRNFLLTLFLIQILTACSSDSNPGTTDEPDPPEPNAEVSFTLSSQTLGNTRSFGLAIADVDLDGDPDILFANYVGYSTLWLNNGDGEFTQSSQTFGTISSETHDVDLGDLNGDGYPDAILANHGEASRVYLNNGDGTFTITMQQMGAARENAHTVQLLDIENDGDLDAYFYNGSVGNRLWLNDGAGSFTMREIDYGGSDSNKQLLGDFNGDGFIDMYLSFRSKASEIWFNDGVGNLAYSGTQLIGCGDFLCFADIEGDGDLDIATGTPELRIFTNNNGSFSAGDSFGELATKTVLFDADGDGDRDLATGEFQEGNKFWLNDNGSFESKGTLFGNSEVHSMESADFNNDGKPDIVLGLIENSGGNRIYFNTTE